MDNRKLVISEDGSPTVFQADLNVHFHSTHGAVQESMHVFIEYGFRLFKKEKLHIFEMGFGTGLNALLTYIEAERNGIDVNYTAVDLFPLGPEIYRSIDLHSIDSLKDNTAFFGQLMDAAWNKNVVLNDHFTLHKKQVDIRQYSHPPYFDLVYFDAFAPSAQPELWTADVMQQMYDMLLPEGMLTTYCAQGQFKRNLKQVGFNVESVPGPPGKREMTIARKLV